MKKQGQAGKWVRGVLGFVCLLLVINIVRQFGGFRTGTRRVFVPSGVAAGTRPAPGPGVDELSRYDPEVRVDLLKKLQSRPLPQLERDPFGGEAPRVAPQPVAPPPAPPPPPPPPPIPLKTLGYSEKGNGRQEAFLTDDQETYVVHEGETFAQRYRVIRITPRFVEIQDESTHQTVQLPFTE